MNTPRHVIAVATTYFHILASRLSLTLIDRPAVLVQSLLFLACKSEEEHRRLRDIITVVFRMLHPGGEWLHLGDSHSKLREHIVTTEQLILRFLGFNLNVDLPHRYMYNYLRKLNASHTIAQLSTAVLNDLHAFSIILEYKPSSIAAACLVVAIEISMSSLVSSSKDVPPDALSIGGGSSEIDPNSPTLVMDCMKSIGADLVIVMEIASRAIELYKLPPARPLSNAEGVVPISTTNSIDSPAQTSTD
jgi:hypothetical protein